MSAEPLPILKPLIEDINSQHIGYFLMTNHFRKLMIKWNAEVVWDNTYQKVKRERTYMATFLDHEPFDCLDAFILIANNNFTRDKDAFYNFVHMVIYHFHYWKDKDINLPFDELIEDYEMLGFPEKMTSQLSALKNEKYGIPGPSSAVPDEIWNADRLQETLNKMDKAIRNGEYNLTLTYCYSALEGLFKSFIQEKELTPSPTDQLPKLAVFVRDHLKSEFASRSQQVPEQMLNLIPTITNAVANARNSHSESHFDKTSEQWMAEFSRDCVHSIGRLIVNFLNQ